ncbi:unnamed protein product, partial [Porites lobata]
SHTFQSDQSLPCALGFCAACGSVVLNHAARVFDYFVVIEIGFMDNQVQITETISRIDSEKNQRAKAGSMAFRSRTFHAMYLAAGSFVFLEVSCLHEMQPSRTV